jgi:undecaprenyl pyrophosphate phosphatase UppP
MARFNVDKVAVAYVETLSSAVKANPATTYEENQRSQRWRSWRDLALYVVAAAIVHLVFNRNKR